MRCASPSNRRRVSLEDFGTPESLLVAPDVSREQKRRLLEDWSKSLVLEARTRSGPAVATERPTDLLRRVRSAIDLLDSPPSDVRRPSSGTEHVHAASSGRR